MISSVRMCILIMCLFEGEFRPPDVKDVAKLPTKTYIRQNYCIFFFLRYGKTQLKPCIRQNYCNFFSDIRKLD